MESYLIRVLIGKYAVPAPTRVEYASDCKRIGNISAVGGHEIISYLRAENFLRAAVLRSVILRDVNFSLLRPALAIHRAEIITIVCNVRICAEAQSGIIAVYPRRVQRNVAHLIPDTMLFEHIGRHYYSAKIIFFKLHTKFYAVVCGALRRVYAGYGITSRLLAEHIFGAVRTEIPAVPFGGGNAYGNAFAQLGRAVRHGEKAGIGDIYAADGNTVAAARSTKQRARIIKRHRAVLLTQLFELLVAYGRIVVAVYHRV